MSEGQVYRREFTKDYAEPKYKEVWGIKYNIIFVVCSSASLW